MVRRHELHTADGRSIEDMLEMARRLFDKYNEAEKPFTELFAETVSEQTFYQEPRMDDIYWDRLADEGEQPRTMREEDYDDRWTTIRTDTFSKGLGMTPKYVRKTDSSDILDKLQRLLEGATNTQERLVYNVLENGIADGSGNIWYEVRDYGEYEHAQDHNHVFDSTQALFGDSNAHLPHEHIEEAKHQLTHHGVTGPFVALVGEKFKRKTRDELAWDASYNVPMANNMRATAVSDLDITIDGVGLVQSPWMTEGHMYVMPSSASPIKFLPERPVQATRPNGATVRSPGDLLGAHAEAEFGCRMVDPLAAVEVTADDVTTE